MKIKTSEIRETLHCDSVSRKGDIITAKKSYFWGVTSDGSAFAALVEKQYPNARVVDYGNHFHHFVGKAKSGSRQDSYYWVKFRLYTPETLQRHKEYEAQCAMEAEQEMAELD